MNFSNHPHRLRAAILFCFVVLVGWSVRSLTAFAPPVVNAESFEKEIKPFLTQNCVKCHNTENSIAGVRVDQLDAAFEDRHIALWESMKHRIGNGTMPPKGLPQPTAEQRKVITEWITAGLEAAKLRPTPKNGSARRLTVSQYRNTLKELLKLEDDLTNRLPPDAISKDGFVNNQDTLQLSPTLLEAYFEIADEALRRAIVDPKAKPAIQSFRMDLGAGVNPKPLAEKLILGAGSALLDNKDFMVTQVVPVKPFPFEPVQMRTKWRFIEGYQGNDTVRGWREYDSIYHAVYADMRGSGGYPKGKAFSTVPEGLLLRPAIPNDEIFGADGTYGPKANFKISLRQLPDDGRFRVVVTAARYNDGLLLDSTITKTPASTGASIEIRDTDQPHSLAIPKAGIYQVDVIAAAKISTPPPPDSTHLTEGLVVTQASARIEGKAKLTDSPFGKALTLNADSEYGVVPHSAAMNTGDGDFTVAAWFQPKALRKGAVLSIGGRKSTGWVLGVLDNKGGLRFDTKGTDQQSNGMATAPAGTVKVNTWQHAAVVVRRGKADAILYVNGYPVARGQLDPSTLDNPAEDFKIGHAGEGEGFRGDIDDVRMYRRALTPAEIQALVQPGKQFISAPPADKGQDVTLTLAGRQFVSALKQPAFLAVRLEAGKLPFALQHSGVIDIEKVVFTPITEDSDVAKKFLAFEKRAPKLGVHMGFRRDCGSTFAPVGPPKVVSDIKFTKYIFEGTMRNYPNPEVEKDNVNYLAGVREIAVRSEYTDGRDMPRLAIKSVEFEGPYYDTWPPVSHKNIFIDSSSKQDPNSYAKQILHSFATRAFRRPVTTAEDASLFDVYKKSAASGRSFQDSVRDALQVALTSPQFLFLIEKSATPAAEPLESYELASKLSYFLWNSPPDATTLRLAANGTLRKQLDAEVDRMVASPKFSNFTTEFVAQWLSLDKFSVLEPDRKKFPSLTRDARAQLRQEPIQFIQYLLQKNLPAKNLIDSDFVIANETVATYYDLGTKPESGFDFVAIAHGRKELGGVLTQPAIMAGLSDGRESNPVKRGAWMARKIVAEPPADPPPNVPAVKEDANLTLRQRLEQHRNQPGCKQCHSKIDPWGVAMEEFDANGRLKEKLADARSTLPDNTEVNGVNDLKRYLSQDRIDQVAYSVMKHMATYANGRTLSNYELNLMRKESQKLKADGYRMKDLVHFVVNSSSFLEK